MNKNAPECVEFLVGNCCFNCRVARKQMSDSLRNKMLNSNIKRHKNTQRIVKCIKNKNISLKKKV